jgi:uncharacterized protein (DUF58 family)
MVRRRSLLFIISDFLSVPGWDRRLSMMAHRHETLAVRLVDPGEGEFPDVGPVVLEDSETGEQLFVDTHDRGFRKRYAELARTRREGLQAMLNRVGVDLLELSTDGDMARDIVRFSSARAQRRAAHSSRALARPRAG